MAKFESNKPPKGDGGQKGYKRAQGNPGGGDGGNSVHIVGPEDLIVEPRCPVCMSELRLRWEYLLAIHTPYKELERISQGEINYRSFSNHAKKHMKFEDESIRSIIEYEAGLMNENLEVGVRGAFLRRTALDVSIRKFFEALTAGEIPIEAGDVIKMIELREKLDAQSASTQIEQYELQFNAFKEAIEVVCPPEMMAKILDVVRQKLQTVDRPALQPPADE